MLTILHLDVLSASGSFRKNREDDEHKLQFYFSVQPSGKHYLELEETGEIFYNEQHYAGEKRKSISARIYIMELSEKAGEDQMRYVGEAGDGFIDFRYWLPEHAFAMLRDHILAGHPPKLISIYSEAEAFRFDGRSNVELWKNLAQRRIPLSEIDMGFSYYGSFYGDKFGQEPVDRLDYADYARVARAVTGRLIAIERLVKWGLIVGASCVGFCAGLLLKSAIHP